MLVDTDTAPDIYRSTDFSQSICELVPDGYLLLVTSAGFKKRGALDTLIKRLGERLTVCDQITPNPDIEQCLEWIRVYADKGIVAVVGLGGGSALDVAKILSCGLVAKAKGFEQLDKSDKHDRLLTIAVPTTAGSGAEITPFATVWNRQASLKHSIQPVPVHAVILDPTLTLTLPRDETLYSGLDALSHALESLWNINSTPATELLAEKALNMICSALPRVLQTPGDLAARTDMQEAALIAGTVISSTKTALAHAISYPLTLRFAVPHGLACSVTLPAIMELVGVNNLKISVESADKLYRMLVRIDLGTELTRYVSWQKLRSDFKVSLDASRAGNFSLKIGVETVNQIIERSEIIYSEGLKT